MHGLPPLQHHIVSHVHDGAEAPETGASQPLTHPQRGVGACVETSHDAPDIAWTGGGGEHPHLQDIRDDGRNGAYPGGRDGAAEQDPDLTGDAGDPQAITPIGGHVHFDRLVIQPQEVPHVGA